MTVEQQIKFENLLSLQSISVSYGREAIVKNVSLNLSTGEIGCLLGPSGCGKSTLLRSIAGFEPIIKGNIQVAGKTVSDSQSTLAPEKRNIGMVFQDVALFPHINIEKNIAFGIKHLPYEKRHARVRQLLELINLPEVADRFPHELSGGQQQRVALARALAPKPQLILLDEPFSGLDAKLRETLVPQVRSILKQEKVSALMVSHDQSEAFAIADKVAVMNQGEIHQWDNAYNSYHHPQSRFVASFIGKSKFLPAKTICHHCIETSIGTFKSEKTHGFEPGKHVDVLVRLDDVKHDLESPYTGTITKKDFHGSFFTYELELTEGTSLFCNTPAHYPHQYNVGDLFNIKLTIEHLVLFNQ